MAEKKSTKGAQSKVSAKSKTSAMSKAAAAKESAAKRKAAQEKAAKEAEAQAAKEAAERQAALEAQQAEYARVLEGEELDAAVEAAARYHLNRGRPEVAARLRYLKEHGDEINVGMCRTDIINPFTVDSASPAEPPRVGPGSGVETWRAYARAVASEKINDTLVDEVSRDDLITMLIVNGYIEAEPGAGAS